MSDEYKRSCEDELDWAEVEQLHKATLQISKSCFEFKKIFAGLIGVSLAILVKLTDNKIDHSYFSVPLLICLGFWVADFTAYYYQRTIRINIREILIKIAKRNSLENWRDETIKISWFSSAFNLSMSLYFVLAGLVFLSWFAFALEWIS